MSPGTRSPVPFVVGLARSGTTLLRMMLDSHPELAIPPETHFIPVLIGVHRRSGGSPAAIHRTILRDPRWEDFGLSAEVLRERLTNTPLPDAAAVLDVFYGLYAERFGKPRWGDKTPPYVNRMAEIAAAYPRAHFVHIIRDGRDVAVSVRGQQFGPNTIGAAARNWRARIAAARRQAEQLPHYLELRYERLVTAPEPELQRLCRYLGLDYQPEMLRYHERAGDRLRDEQRELKLPRQGIRLSAQQRAALHQRVAQPPQPARIGVWREALSPREQKRFLRHAGAMLEALGYPLE